GKSAPIRGEIPGTGTQIPIPGRKFPIRDVSSHFGPQSRFLGRKFPGWDVSSHSGTEVPRLGCEVASWDVKRLHGIRSPISGREATFRDGQRLSVTGRGPLARETTFGTARSGQAASPGLRSVIALRFPGIPAIAPATEKPAFEYRNSFLGWAAGGPREGQTGEREPLRGGRARPWRDRLELLLLVEGRQARFMGQEVRHRHLLVLRAHRRAALRQRLSDRSRPLELAFVHQGGGLLLGANGEEEPVDLLRGSGGCGCHRTLGGEQDDEQGEQRERGADEADCPGHSPAGGCQSSTLFPSGSMTWANFPYSESWIFSRTLQPSSRKALTRASRSSTR